jgi:hypothetical protein
MMKKFLLVSAVMGAGHGVAASAAMARTPLLVTGAGASTTSGQVVVSARATGPTLGSLPSVAPATGFLRAPGVSPQISTISGTVNLSGRVTCIGVRLQDAVAVSGTLDTPIVSAGGFVWRNFTLLINNDPSMGRGWRSGLASAMGRPSAHAEPPSSLWKASTPAATSL